MKTIKELINESGSDAYGKGAFSKIVKCSNNEYLKWKKDTKDNKNLMFGEVNNYPQYELIYLVNHEKKMVEHIATYNTKKEELYSDDFNREFFKNFN